MLGWGDNDQQRNDEFWSRGNGWVAMALVNTLHYMPRDMAERKPLERLFIKMMDTLFHRKFGHCNVCLCDVSWDRRWYIASEKVCAGYNIGV